MEELSQSEKRKIINARYYAKKKSEKGEDFKISYQNLKLENKQLKMTIQKLKEEIEDLKNENGVMDWSDDD